MTQTITPAFHVMAKPTGARCNLRCDYCFFLEKVELYPGSDFRMTDEVMAAYVRQTIEAQRVPFVTLAWQGGEPTLMGLDFFRRALEVEREALPAGWQVERTIQTNGALLDDDWAAFLAENDVLVGLSLDGPRALHDAYRHDSAGRSVFDRVEAAARLLQKHGVEFNVLCTVNAANAAAPARRLPLLPRRARRALPAVHPHRRGGFAAQPRAWPAPSPTAASRRSPTASSS